MWNKFHIIAIKNTYLYLGFLVIAKINLYYNSKFKHFHTTYPNPWMMKNILGEIDTNKNYNFQFYLKIEQEICMSFENFRTHCVCGAWCASVTCICDRTNTRKRKLVETQASQRERFNEPATPEAIVGGIVLVFRVMNAKLNNIRRRTFTLAPRAFIDTIRASSRMSAISFRRASYIQKIIWARMKKFRY